MLPHRNHGEVAIYISLLHEHFEVVKSISQIYQSETEVYVHALGTFPCKDYFLIRLYSNIFSPFSAQFSYSISYRMALFLISQFPSLYIRYVLIRAIYLPDVFPLLTLKGRYSCYKKLIKKKSLGTEFNYSDANWECKTVYINVYISIPP